MIKKDLKARKILKQQKNKNKKRSKINCMINQNNSINLNLINQIFLKKLMFLEQVLLNSRKIKIILMILIKQKKVLEQNLIILIKKNMLYGLGNYIQQKKIILQRKNKKKEN